MQCIKSQTSSITVKNPNEIPYAAARSLALKHSDDFLEEGVKHVLMDKSLDLEKDHFATSCVNTLAALANLFFGTAKASLMMDVIRETVPVQIVSHDQGRWKYYFIVNLFEGVILHAYTNQRRELSDFSSSVKRDLVVANVGFWMDYIEHEIQKGMSIDHILISPRINFNARVIDQLKNKILTYETFISKTFSMGYMVAIIEFSPQTDSYNFDHCFLVEQYLAEYGLRYRVYHSWINEFTLKTAIDKGLLTPKTTGEILRFFDKIDNLYSYSPTETYDSVFGCKEGKEGPTKPTFYKNTLRGPGLRYIAEPINLSHCQTIYQEMTDRKIKVKKKYQLG